MANATIIHGSYGSPNENWIPWLKNELEKLNFKVFVPKFPTPVGQSLEAWEKFFKKYEKSLDENSIIIGHSLGPAFILRILEKSKKPIKAAFFVSGFVDFLGLPEFDEINKTFVGKEFDWNKIKQNCKKFILFHSDNDPYVPIENAKRLAKALGVEIIIIKNAGHFNKAAGYLKFEELLEKIKETA
jgi:hypothetical protein